MVDMIFVGAYSTLLRCCLYKLFNSPAELCECGAAVLEAALGGGDGSGGRSAALGWVGDGGELLALFAEGGGGGAGALAELCGAGADLTALRSSPALSGAMGLFFRGSWLV